MKKALKFGDGPVKTLKKAEQNSCLAATVRYNDEKEISEGDALDLVEADTGESIGDGVVTETSELPVKHALDLIHHQWGACYRICDVAALVTNLNMYYGDLIGKETAVKAIALEPSLEQEVKADDQIHYE